jgi:hypothetical protein
MKPQKRHYADVFLGEKAAQDWSQLAHRIGRGLRLGVEASRKRADAPPDLRL